MSRRYKWCPHLDCIPLMCNQDSVCGGRLPEPAPHDDGFNTHRFCIKTSGEVFDLQVNSADCWWLTRILNRLRNDTRAAAEAAKETEYGCSKQ